LDVTRTVASRQSAQKPPSNRSVALRADSHGCCKTELQHVRRARGFTQGTLEDATKIRRRHLSEIERSKTRIYWSTVGRIARALAGNGATEQDIERLVAELVEFPTEETTDD
jgi:transcriptional regulator with XRE-family HTH domain